MPQHYGQEADYALCQDEELCNRSMILFHAAGHTLNKEPLTRGKAILDTVYPGFRHYQALTPSDRITLNCVETASLLFTNGAEHFDRPASKESIDYFAVSLNTTDNDRSQLSYDVHQIIARMSPSALSLVLFEANGRCMFSFAQRRKDQRSLIVLSDWYPVQQVYDDAVLERIHAGNLSSQSARDFFQDFAYNMAREYYKHPTSFEYAAYEMFPLKTLDVLTNFQDRETRNDIIRENLLFNLREYQNDYVVEESNEEVAKTLGAHRYPLKMLEPQWSIDENDLSIIDVLLEDDAALDEEEDPYSLPVESAAITTGRFLPPSENQAVFAPEVMGAVAGVLMAHFPHGFKVDSPIELMRFRNFAAKTPNCDIRLCDEKLKSAILSCGTLFEGKVYVVKEETGRRLRDVIDAEFASGAEVMYYTAVYVRHENWLVAGSVVSEDMLKKLLNTLYPSPSYRHRDNYFLAGRHDRNESAIIRDEILRIWGDATLRDYAHISARLPYIPIHKVKYALAQNSDFIWNSPEVYTHIGMIDIAEEARSKIRAHVAKTCQAMGYASITDIPLGDIKEHNREMALAAIYKAVFVSVLADSYDIRDKILTRKGDTRSALALLKEYCRTVDRCSLQDLIEIKHKLTGERHPTRALEAGHAVLVRIGADAFVAERRVTFDIQRTDDTLDLLVTGDYLPLQSITTFAAFPYCGQVWNLFLLESYCRRFSRRFRFDVLAFNSQNVGAIIRQSCLLSYAEIMADALAVSDVELEVTNVLAFLCDSGYLGKRSYTKSDELIQRAIAIRERRA